MDLYLSHLQGGSSTGLLLRERGMLSNANTAVSAAGVGLLQGRVLHGC